MIVQKPTHASPAAPDSAGRSHPPALLSWSIWALAATFYLSGFYQRVSPAVMTDELMRTFSIGAASLGNLSAFYYYSYLAMQIPTGILIDSWGARKLLISGSIAAAVGTMLFASTDNFALACLGRLIIGAASAVGWVTLLTLATHWFPAKRFAMLSGLGLLFGNLGALFAQVPLRLAIQSFGWRPVVFVSAIVVLSIGLLAFFFVKNDPVDVGFATYAPADVHRGDSSFVERLKGFGRIFGFRNTWLIFLAQGGIVGSILSFTGLWGSPYLRSRFGLQQTVAAEVCSVMIVCWAVASPLCGALSDRIGRRKPIYVAGVATALLGWIAMFYTPNLPLAGFIAIAAVTSVASGSVVIGFAYAKESVPPQYLGSISGTVNIGNMIGPTLLTPAIGAVLDRHWTGQLIKGAHVYGVHAYELAFLLMIGWLTLSTILLSLTRETGCEQC
ncbi:MFS transporter [Terriglobus roseus]|uniref:Lysosomal dipeptide transporter MFSD1 n=1 Tax=Terriglobus roseus TaxID=392734 RepID=A0A1H4NZB7_9BACT|nr:MFS transporter [Terriglobus roseus]SEC00375.1 Sugar phosphate permease [Terriglobus roseus]